MFERYGVREEDAQHLVRWHFRALNQPKIAEPFRLLYTLARGSVRVFQVEHCGKYFYPVLRRGRLSKEWVIATYLAEDMVWDNMMGEFTMSFLLPQKLRTDAPLDFDDDPENNGCSAQENIVDYDSLF